MLDLKPLRQFGLHYKDIQVYKALLTLGKAKSGPLIRESGLVSSSFYGSINTLVEKGLASFEVKNNVRYYKPEPLESLIEKSKQTTASLEIINSELAKLKPAAVPKGDVDVLEGYHGMERAFTEHVEGFSKDMTIRVIGFGSQAPKRKSLDSFLEKVNQASLQKKCRVILLLDQVYLNEKNPAKILKNKIIRYLPSLYFGPIAYNITEKEVMLTLWGNRPTIIRLKNPVVIKSFITNFDFMIKHSK